MRTLADCIKIDENIVAAPRTSTNKKGPVYPIVARIACFEPGMGAHIVASGIDILAAPDGGDHCGWAMAKAVIDDFDDRPIIGLYDIALSLPI